MNTKPTQDAEAGRLLELGMPVAAPARPAGTARLRYANRMQATFRVCALDTLIPEDHAVRIVWTYVEALDLTPLLGQIRAVDNGPGHVRRIHASW